MDDSPVRAHIFERVLSTGRIPLVREIAAAMNVSVDEVNESLNRLADAHMVVMQREGGEILMAMPFSAAPTAFRVRTSDLEAYGNCIWDGLGALVMMKKDGFVETACGCCNAVMTLTVSGGSLLEQGGVVHFGVPVRHWWDDVVFT